MATSSASDRRPPTLREGRPGDLDRLWRLDQLCFEPGIAYSQRDLQRFLAMPRAVCVVAEDGDTLCGFALAYSRPSALAHVVTLDVDPTFRRRGLGRRLIESVLERSAAAGAKRAVLEVDVRNSGAIAFYRKLAFREAGRLAAYYGPGQDAFQMVKALLPTPAPGRRSANP
ncbi:MAG TPA: GNAT family N-acetyltransferase [Thermoanaerobaculia bacterium]|nr:GNAT family N-acetyltransferase [Thermoanaerobaculia bacterium]